MKISVTFLVALVLLGAGSAAHPTLAGEPRPFVEGSWRQLLQAHAGRPVIIHFWGLTCVPCRTEMPQWGKLGIELRNVALITIHAEPLPPKPALVHEMLQETGLENAENWQFASPIIERLRREIDHKWQGELPMTLLISNDGTSQTIMGPADLNVVRQWVTRQE
jgi:thiol-disulfide isomerase/thioredoxin